MLAADLSWAILATSYLPDAIQLEFAGVCSSSCQLLLHLDVTLHLIPREVDFGGYPAVGVHPTSSLQKRWGIIATTTSSPQEGVSVVNTGERSSRHHSSSGRAACILQTSMGPRECVVSKRSLYRNHLLLQTLR
jgi:hypothetical protein